MCALHDTVANELRAHYARVAPLLHAAFGGMPIISASFPQGLGTKAYWHTKPLPLEASVFAWCLDKLHAVEFHSWFPAPGCPTDCLGMARIFLETAGTATDAHLREAARLTRAALHTHSLDAILMLDGTGGIALLVPFDDHPAYDDVRTWLHGFANALAAAHGSLFTTEPNTQGGSLVHIHVSHNAERMFSVLPYSARGLDALADRAADPMASCSTRCRPRASRSRSSPRTSRNTATRSSMNATASANKTSPATLKCELACLEVRAQSASLVGAKFQP
jgi:DNA primase